MMIRALFLVSLLSISTAHADWKSRFSQLQFEGQARLMTDAPQDLVSGTYEQTLDHNSTVDTRTFSQRYWISLASNPTPRTPVYYYICGEGACSENSLRVLKLLSEQTPGHLVALEHRYYGQSQPFQDLSTANLRFLSTDQALKDLIQFKAYLQKRFNIAGPWFTVGGSYPGSLSAFARALYPQEFAGAWASSAPVLAKSDFFEYDRHVAEQAGPKCLAAIQSVTAEVEKALTNPKSEAEIKARFHASSLRNQEDFLYLLADSAAAAVQYGLREKFCTLLGQEGVQGYVKAVEMVSSYFGDMVEMSFQAAEDISVEAHNGPIGMRQWAYQSCTEYGYWQNANPDSRYRARSARINGAYHAQVCKRLFGIDFPIPDEQTNATYFARLSAANRIFMTNGNEDPWMNLSLLPGQSSNEIESVVMRGASHCSDFRASEKEDVQRARSRIVELVQVWLRK